MSNYYNNDEPDYSFNEELEMLKDSEEDDKQVRKLEEKYEGRESVEDESTNN
jgi:hypothetical protein